MNEDENILPKFTVHNMNEAKPTSFVSQKPKVEEKPIVKEPVKVEQQSPQMSEQARVNPVSPAPIMNPARPSDTLTASELSKMNPGEPSKPVVPVFTGHNLSDPITKKAPAPTIKEPIKKPEPVPELEKKIHSQPTIRTYEGDVADAIANKNTSALSMAVAESKRRDGQNSIGSAPEKSHIVKKLFIALVSLVLVGGGAVGGYYLYSISPIAPIKEVPQTTETIAPKTAIPTNSWVAISIDNKSLGQIMDGIRTEINKIQAPNTIKEIILTKTKDQKKYRVSLEEMQKIMDIHPPDILVRAVSDTPMLAVYADGLGEKSIFVLATVNYYQNAFAGLLQWEIDMPDDLKAYLYQDKPNGITTAPLQQLIPALNITSTSTATTTATSTKKTTKKTTSTKVATTTATSTATTTTIYPDPIIAPYTIIHGNFVDRIIKNKDVREFVTTDKQILFLYSFIDNTKLVITSSEATLSAILSRLEQQAFVR